MARDTGGDGTGKRSSTSRPSSTSGKKPRTRSTGSSAARARTRGAAAEAAKTQRAGRRTAAEPRARAKGARGTTAEPRARAKAARVAPEPPPPPAARTQDAVRVYGAGPTAVRAIDQITVGFASGRFTAIMGPSGSGKSTLLHCAAGLDRLTSGKAFIGDVDLTALDEKRLTVLRRDKVGFVFQSYNLVPTLSAIENITLPLDLAGREHDRAWIDQVVETLRLTDRLDHRPSELSGGQQQRVAMARALAGRPEIVFADEPTGNLDSTASAELLGFLREAVDTFGQTIVMVTHDPVAAGHTHAVLFLADGKIVGDLEKPTAKKVLDRISELET